MCASASVKLDKVKMGGRRTAAVTCKVSLSLSIKICGGSGARLWLASRWELSKRGPSLAPHHVKFPATGQLLRQRPELRVGERLAVRRRRIVSVSATTCCPGQCAILQRPLATNAASRSRGATNLTYHYYYHHSDDERHRRPAGPWNIDHCLNCTRPKILDSAF